MNGFRHFLQALAVLSLLCASSIVTAKTSVTVTAIPQSITLGNSTKLHWSSTGATSCSWFGGTLPASGSTDQFPTSTTDYTFTCRGSGGSASSTIRVTVSSAATPVTPPAPPKPIKNSTVGFTAATYSAAQSSGSVRVGVVRSGTNTTSAKVTYTTVDGSAIAGKDYTRKTGTLTWKAGDTGAKALVIALNNSTPFSGSKTFTIALSGVSGATLNSRVNATVKLAGNTASAPPAPVPAPLPPSGNAMGKTAAARLLSQSTFGATLNDINESASQSYDQWFTDQAAATPSLYLASTPNKDADWYPVWLTNCVTAPDQLRQRIAFALSEILVVSNNGGPLTYQSQATAAYMDLLVKNAFGNYRDLLEKVTLSSAMGQYLSMFRNDKPNAATGVHADENYAREIMQLFSIGLVKLNIDGTVALNTSGVPIATYSQSEVEGLARVFTGWGSKPTTSAFGEDSWTYDVDFVNQMVSYDNHHDKTAKKIIGGVVVPAGGSAATDLKISLDTIFNHPNVGPFISRQLIQRLVTSNPSKAYVRRVATVFNDNGDGERGDLLAVVKAILTDTEAVHTSSTGKLREPLIRLTNLWRAFDATDSRGRVSEYSVLLSSNEMFAQAPLQSPSVFNFFRPDYRRSGELTDLNLVAPEFQTTNESTLVLTQNELQQLAYQFVDGTGKKYAGADLDYSSTIGASTVLLKTKQWEPFAASPSGLIDQMNLVLMGGTMPAAMRTSLINYVTAIPASTPARRVVEAADLIINSPQYAVQF